MHQEEVTGVRRPLSQYKATSIIALSEHFTVCSGSISVMLQACVLYVWTSILPSIVNAELPFALHCVSKKSSHL